jgi:hypothetical protein
LWTKKVRNIRSPVTSVPFTELRCPLLIETARLSADARLQKIRANNKRFAREVGDDRLTDG